jgi:hypothetical protein
MEEFIFENMSIDNVPGANASARPRKMMGWARDDVVLLLE